MTFTVKIHGGTVHLCGSHNHDTWYFQKYTSFTIWPWTNIEAKIEKIRKKWEEHYQIVQKNKA